LWKIFESGLLELVAWPVVVSRASASVKGGLIAGLRLCKGGGCTTMVQGVTESQEKITLVDHGQVDRHDLWDEGFGALGHEVFSTLDQLTCDQAFCCCSIVSRNNTDIAHIGCTEGTCEDESMNTTH
jgi:hypothetical protein